MEVSPAQGESQPCPRRCPALLQPLVIDRTSFACVVLCSVVFGFWTVELTHSLSPTAVAFFLLMPLSMYYLGRGLLRWIDPPAGLGQPFPLAFLAGSLVSGLLLFVMAFLSPLPIHWNCTLVLLIALLFQGVPSRPAQASGNREGTFCTLLAVIVSLAAATCWTRDLRPYARQDGNEIVYRCFSDYFVHAFFVGQLRAEHNLLRLGDPDLVGLPLPFYHYGSYIFPAVVSSWTGQTALDSLASFWTPFGVLLTGLAAYALGSAWWSSRAGLAALIGVLLMPDASTYGAKDAYHSYHWLVAVSPGLLYGIAASALALLFVTRGILPTRWRCLVAGFGFAVMCIPLRAHLFIVVCPLLVLWVVLFKDGWTGRQRLLVGMAMVAVGGFALLLADRLEIGPTILPFGGDRSLDLYFQELATRFSDPILVVPRVVWSTLGVPGVVCPIVARICFFLRKRLEPVDAVPLLALLIFLACTLLLPLNDRRGTPDELRHRPFVWAYFVVAAWTWGKVVSILHVPSAIIVVASFTMLAWPWTRGANVQDPQRPWGDRFINVRVASGLGECAGFLRQHAAEHDIVQEDVTLDIPVLGALAERRCYLGRDPAYWAQWDPKASLVHESLRRAELLRRLRTATTNSELRELAKQTGIGWYVAHPAEKLDWPSEILARPAFEANGYRVYDLKSP
jgi:hypothetical protein